MTGDNEAYNISNVQEADIILSTPKVTRGFLCFNSDMDMSKRRSKFVSDILFFFN